MTKTISTLHAGILKNVEAENPQTGQAMADLIVAEANRREHLDGSIESATWHPDFGISILVQDASRRQHLANVIDLPARVTRYRSGVLSGEARVGVFLGYRVTIWNLDL